MTWQIITVLCVIGIATVFFAFEWLAPEVVAIGAMLLLLLSGIIKPEQAFAGFGSGTVIMIAGLLVMGAALLKTGVVDIAGRTILSLVGERHAIMLPAIIVSIAFLSAIISNTAATAFFLPVVLGLCVQTKVSASKYLLPMAFASIITSSVTLISTSTNLVINELMERSKMPPMAMFELSPVGLVISFFGLVYLLTVGKKLLPERTEMQSSEIDFGLRPFLSDILILPKSSLIGKSVQEFSKLNNFNLNVVRVVRDKKFIMPRSNTTLNEGDVLVVEGGRESILKVKGTEGIEIKADAKLSDPEVDPEDLKLVEAVVLPPSRLIGKSLKDVHFRDRYEVQVLAVNRHQPLDTHKLSLVRIKAGDVLLLQGRAHHLEAISDNNLIRLIGAVDKNTVKSKYAPLAIGIFLTSLLIATLGLLSFPVACLLGAFVMLVTGCIGINEAYQKMEWQILVLIGAMLSIGTAMEASGTGKYVAAALIELIGTTSPRTILSMFFLLAVLLTQAMSNQAAAIVLFPIAIETALQLDYQARPIVMMIAIAASCSYLTPLEPSCLMVYGPGNYKFKDFFIVGMPLTVIIYFIAILMVPWVWAL